MIQVRIMSLALILTMLAAIPAWSDSRVANRNAERLASSASLGLPAPDFLATDTNGQTHKLSGLKGKIVVLEWTNPLCPYVRKFYDSHAMQTMQQEATVRNIVWFAISSAAKGREGFMNQAEANRLMVREQSHETARILDPTGTMARLYGASATPHMFIIDQQGRLAYAGAMDDQASTDRSTLTEAHNYIQEALTLLEAGEPVGEPSTKPYGCSIKF